MKKVLVCSNHGRAIAQVLMAAIAESGIGILGQPLEFKNNDKDMGGFIVDNFDILKINPTNGPEVKRGKGKVKRWRCPTTQLRGANPTNINRTQEAQI